MGGFCTWRVFISSVCFLAFIHEGTTRVARDVTGHYHGEHHHLSAEVNSTDGKTGFPPNCLCVVKDTGCIGREEYTKKFVGISTLVCGHAYERCCFEDPWPGLVDNFAGVAPCVPQEECQRFYGQQPTDVRDYGILGPCPGFGAVRCLHPPGGSGAPPVPPVVTIVVPIVPVPETPPSVHYEVPVPATEPPTQATTPPPAPENPPSTNPPPTTQATTPPPTPPPAPHVPPPTNPPPPPPTTTPIPPLYDLPPSPPETYGPPEEPPVVSYEPPKAILVDTPEPVIVAEPVAVSRRPGPPYLWQRFNSPYRSFPYVYGWPGHGFRFRSNIGLGYGLFG